MVTCKQATVIRDIFNNTLLLLPASTRRLLHHSMIEESRQGLQQVLTSLHLLQNSTQSLQLCISHHHRLAADLHISDHLESPMETIVKQW